MPNGFAYLVLFSWPLVTIVLFRAMPIPKAIAWTIIAGYLLLPTRAGIDLPLLPPIDKELIPSLSALVMTGVMLLDRNTPRPPQPGPGGKWLIRGLLALVLATPFLTVLTNSDPVIAGRLYLPGMRVYDGFSMLNGVLVALIPFVLARRFFVAEEDRQALLKVLVLAGLTYSLPVLFEVRMSPQLNVWIYGFFPHSFAQHMRAGGFRPLVFLHHGLWLAIFMATTVLAAAVLWRLRKGTAGGGRWMLVLLWLLGTLVLVKSLGAFLITLLILPFLLFASPRRQVQLAAVLAAMVLFYPMLRGAGLLPVNAVASLVEMAAPERAESFRFRLNNEDRLLDRANLKPLAGWGMWGRSRVYSDTEHGDSVTDGLWVIVMGSEGWLGYLGKFGLLTVPVILLWWRQRSNRLSLADSGLALVLAAGLIDLLPNATLTPTTWLLAGAVAARLGATVSTGDAESPAPSSTRRPARAVHASRTRPAVRFARG